VTVISELASSAGVSQELSRILASPALASRRTRKLLGHIVARTLAGSGDRLTEREIAVRVFGRNEEFDPVSEPVVRIHAALLRRALDRYYRFHGMEGGVRIRLPRRALIPIFD